MSELMKTRARRAAGCALAALPVLMLALPVLAQTTPAAPEAVPTAPSTPDTGDTAWMLTSTALVLMMTIPGLALFYAGMVRKKNVLATMMQSFSIVAVATIVWMVAGYSIAFGEGNYAATEKLIRELLEDADPGVQLPPPTDVSDETPREDLTRETFLGSSKDVNFAGPGAYRAGEGEYAYPQDQAQDTFALEGSWRIETQFATPAGDAGAGIRLDFRAGEVRMVLAGEGEVRVRLDDGKTETIEVSGTPRSYEIVARDGAERAIVEVEVSPGVEAYSFTFG